jgi:vacuolar protein-sorting-associated protein 4
LIRDSVFEPVRRLQTATRFKKINGKFVPCRPDENGQEGKWTEFKKNEIEIDVVSRRDFDEALKRTKPSVDQKQLKEYEQFTASFGQDG